MAFFDNQSHGFDWTSLMEPIPNQSTNAPHGFDWTSLMEPIPNQSTDAPVEAGGFDFNSMIPPEMGDMDFGQSYVPQGLMEQLMGLKMPEMDARGNYGLTPTQQKEAQFKAMGDSLLVAANGFLTKDPKAFTGMGKAYSDTETSILSGYSKANAADVTARLNLGIGQLNAAKGMSDLTQAEVNRRIAEQKYQQEKYKQKGMVGMMKEMSGVLNFAVDETAQIDPRRAATVKQAGILAMQAMEKGDITAAGEILGSLQGLVPDHVAAMLPDMIGLEAAKAAIKYGATAKEVSLMNESFKTQGLNVTIEQGPDGQPVVVNANEALKRKLQENLVKSQINSNNANAQESRQRGNAWEAGGGGSGNALGQAADIKIFSQLTNSLSDYVGLDGDKRKNAAADLIKFGFPPGNDPKQFDLFIQGLKRAGVDLPPEAYMKEGSDSAEPSLSMDTFARWLASDRGVQLRMSLAAIQARKEREFTDLIGRRAKTGATVKK